MTHKQQVASAFGAATATYDSAALAQTRAADRLAELVLGLSLPPNPNVLEVGCGTGLLTRRLLPRIGGNWHVTDLSPAMVEAARTAIGDDKARFRVMDAERPDIPLASVDLIVSNLAAQWFTDLDETVRQLWARLAPGGHLMFSTLGDGSFSEWRAAHQQLGLPCGTPTYPSAEELVSRMPGGTHIIAEDVVVRHPNAHAFIASLRNIGADTPAPGHRPLNAGALRRVMRRMGAPMDITYRVLFTLVPAE